MFNELKTKFLFRCEDCQMVLSVEFEEQEDLDKVQDDKMMLECPCGGRAIVLRD
jgi:hypothetical protein